jgi:hypothetical protein
MAFSSFELEEDAGDTETVTIEFDVSSFRDLSTRLEGVRRSNLPDLRLLSDKELHFVRDEPTLDLLCRTSLLLLSLLELN